MNTNEFEEIKKGFMQIIDRLEDVEAKIKSKGGEDISKGEIDFSAIPADLKDKEEKVVTHTDEIKSWFEKKIL